jgi:hypothetical protein
MRISALVPDYNKLPKSALKLFCFYFFFLLGAGIKPLQIYII